MTPISIRDGSTTADPGYGLRTIWNRSGHPPVRVGTRAEPSTIRPIDAIRRRSPGVATGRSSRLALVAAIASVVCAMAPYSREIGDLLTSHGDWSGTPLAAQWLVPVALAAALVALFRRGQAHVYPALVAALSVELVCRVLWLAHFAGPSMRREVVWFPMFTAIAQFAVRMGVAFEALIISRFDVSRETRARAAGIAIIGGAVLASLCDRLLPDQLVYLWRQYAYLEVTVAMWAAEIWRVVRPVLECRRRRYRLCVAVWFSVLSVSASFVSGGLVCRMIRCSAAVWSVADIATHLALAAVVAATGLALTWGHAPRKRAAKAMAVVQMPAVRAA